MAEGIEDSFDNGVCERNYNNDEDGDVEVISSIVVIS